MAKITTPTKVDLRQIRPLFRKVQNTANSAMDKALVTALEYLTEKAQDILRREIYDNPNRPPYYPGGSASDESLSGKLMDSFVPEVIKVGKSGIIGKLKNTAEEASYLEYGTETHWVAPVTQKMLAWTDPYFGFEDFSAGHTVSGVGAHHFMSRALNENRAAVMEIFKLEVFQSISEQI